MSEPSIAESHDVRGRILELDFALREAISNRAGEMAHQITAWHGTTLRDAFDPAQMTTDELGFLRESCDRLQGHIERARTALEDLRAEINDLQMRRKLTGRSAPASGRSFQA